MKTFKRLILASFAAVLMLTIMSCQASTENTGSENIKSDSFSNSTVPALVSEVMTKEMQSNISPQAVLDELMTGNKRFVNNELIQRDYSAQVKSTTKGQFPKAVILSCIDSRVPVETVFDQGIGDVFVARVAGNVEDKDLLGSMEYGLGVAGSKVLVVMGHESCGAVKSAIDKVDVGSTNVDHLLAQVEPAIVKTSGERNSKDKSYFDTVVKNNVTQTISDIRQRSGIINELEQNGSIKIVGAYYSLENGEVSIIE